MKKKKKKKIPCSVLLLLLLLRVKYRISEHIEYFVFKMPSFNSIENEFGFFNVHAKGLKPEHL